jgi:hypothetical protein
MASGLDQYGNSRLVSSQSLFFFAVSAGILNTIGHIFIDVTTEETYILNNL